ncbi:MAG: hypothetical protein GY862_32640, partial [Gammaproteobacteria bacterium]|nr:hypothetical protein [Gammaproteobacteria bacterium]
MTKVYGSACSYSSVTSAWNGGKHGMVIWQGHGMPTYTVDVMSTPQAAQLKDDYPGHCYQISCHNGKPEQSDNVAYAVLLNAGVSTIASAVQVLYSATMKELGTSGSTRHWAYMYAKKMINAKLPSGAAYNAARPELPVTFSIDWLNCVEMNLYGCPAVGIYTCDDGTNTDEFTVDKNENGFCETTVLSSRSNDKIIFSLSTTGHHGGRVTVYNSRGSLVCTKGFDAGKKQIVWNTNSSKSRAVSRGIYVAAFDIIDNSGKTVQK